MKLSILRTALLTLLTVITPAVVVNAGCYKHGGGSVKEPIWWLKQALVAAQRVERHGWIAAGEEFWTSGRPGSKDGTGGSCVSLGVKNSEPKFRIKMDSQYVMNHWLEHFKCKNGGNSKVDNVEFFYQTNCPKNGTYKETSDLDQPKDELK